MSVPASPPVSHRRQGQCRALHSPRSDSRQASQAVADGETVTPPDPELMCQMPEGSRGPVLHSNELGLLQGPTTGSIHSA